MLKTEDNTQDLQVDITAIILTYNEEKHIERCLYSIKSLAKKIIVIDSYSTDKTIETSKKLITIQERYIDKLSTLRNNITS